MVCGEDERSAAGINVRVLDWRYAAMKAVDNGGLSTYNDHDTSARHTLNHRSEGHASAPPQGHVMGSVKPPSAEWFVI